eukprot:224987-Amorphochlora_amoeboformis.AAC.2
MAMFNPPHIRNTGYGMHTRSPRNTTICMQLLHAHKHARQECTKSVTRVHQECNKSATRVQQECTKSATRVQQECNKSATR